MADAYLLLLKDGDDSQLKIVQSEKDTRPSATDAKKRGRASPIFPVLPKIGKVPQPGDDYFIGFFCFEYPLPAIGKLLAEIPPDKQHGLWFSHGLASVILFANEETEFNAIREQHQHRMRAFELWHVHSEHIIIKALWLNTPAPSPFERSPLSDYDELPREQTLILDLLSHALNTAIVESAQYLPSNFETIERLIPAVNDLIDELVFLFDPNSPCPPGFSKQAAVELATNHAKRQKLIHQRTVIMKTNEGYRVCSPLTPATQYVVSGLPDQPQCTCAEFERHDTHCI